LRICLSGGKSTWSFSTPFRPQPAPCNLEEQEQDYTNWVLQESGGNQTLAEHILGIDRVSLWRKLKRYEVEKG
jgi:DNA-binding NtrC family response regulator